ncbi:MAG: hypothetical protein WBG37_04505 [Desulfobacterales bacterium]|jgi:hypothetical protein
MIPFIPDSVWPVITTIGAALAFLHFQRMRSLVPPHKAGVSDYIYKMARLTGTSEYEVFRKSAEGWPVNVNMIEADFTTYLQTGTVPYYVNDYIRKNKVHIDELKAPPY